MITLEELRSEMQVTRMKLYYYWNNGYSCGCCRQDGWGSIEYTTSDEIIKELLEAHDSYDGCIDFKKSDGVTEETFNLILGSYKDLQSKIEKLRFFRQDIQRARKIMEGLGCEAGKEFEANFIKEDQRQVLEIDEIVTYLGKENLPEGTLAGIYK